jgi:hypothetical protein
MIDKYLDKYKKNIEELREYFQQISKLPPAEVIEELKRLENTKKGLEKKISNIGVQIALIKTLENVAEYRVIDNEVAIALLFELKGRGETSYIDLTDSFDEPTKIATIHYIDILKTAKLIEMETDPSNKLDHIIRVTKKGMSITYIEESLG